MNSKTAKTTAAVLGIFAYSGVTHSDMRPQCGADPTHPGACFSPTLNSQSFYTCGAPPDGDGFLFWSGFGADEHDFIRINLDGTMYAHVSNRGVTGIYCTWDTLASGNCVPGSEEVFIGSVSLQADGVIDEFGNALCPFVASTQGEVRRISDGETVHIVGKLHFVPDSDDVEPPVGCRVQQCRILVPGQR